MIEDLENLKAKLSRDIKSECTLETVFKTIDLVEDIIKVQPKISLSDKWILCSERLPEKTGRYIVTTKATNIINEAYYDVVEAMYWGSIKTWGDIVSDMPTCVITWMPLPEPYKEEK